jgi:release factor glutamine methyltransferase
VKNPTQHSDAPWTTRRLLDWTTQFLENKQVDSPRLASEILLAHTLGIQRIKLYMELDRPASEIERAAFRSLVERAANHEPVQYLTGHAHFYSLTLDVDPRVLIPRPCTEMLVEHVVHHSRLTPGFAAPLVADIGTGSGAIAIALAKNMPDARVLAVDLSSDALELAEHNAQKHDVHERIDFIQGDGLQPVVGQRPHYIVSNPPYIPDHEWADVAPNVAEHEPVLALRAGADGLDVLKHLIAQAPEHLPPHGQLVCEIAASQKQAVLDLANDTPHLLNPHVLNDHENLPRMLVAQRDEY